MIAPPRVCIPRRFKSCLDLEAILRGPRGSERPLGQLQRPRRLAEREQRDAQVAGYIAHQRAAAGRQRQRHGGVELGDGMARIIVQQDKTEVGAGTRGAARIAALPCLDDALLGQQAIL